MDAFDIDAALDELEAAEPDSKPSSSQYSQRHPTTERNQGNSSTALTAGHSPKILLSSTDDQGSHLSHFIEHNATVGFDNSKREQGKPPVSAFSSDSLQINSNIVINGHGDQSGEESDPVHIPDILTNIYAGGISPDKKGSPSSHLQSQLSLAKISEQILGADTDKKVSENDENCPPIELTVQISEENAHLSSEHCTMAPMSQNLTILSDISSEIVKKSVENVTKVENERNITYMNEAAAHDKEYAQFEHDSKDSSNLLLNLDDSVSKSERAEEDVKSEGMELKLEKQSNVIDDLLSLDPLESKHLSFDTQDSYMHGLDSLPPEIFLATPSQAPPEFQSEEITKSPEMDDSENFLTPPSTPGFGPARPEDFDNYATNDGINDVQDMESRGGTSRCSSTSTSSISDEKEELTTQNDVISTVIGQELGDVVNENPCVEAIELASDDEVDDPEADYVTLALPQTRQEGVELGQPSQENFEASEQADTSTQEVGLEVEQSGENRVIGFHDNSETTAEELQELEAELEELEGALEGSLNAEVGESAESESNQSGPVDFPSDQSKQKSASVDSAEEVEAPSAEQFVEADQSLSMEDVQSSSSVIGPEEDATESAEGEEQQAEEATPDGVGNVESEQRRSLIASSHDLGASCSMVLTESEMQLGKVKPNWVPDADSLICMLCETKFSVLKRRHHCRACGRVLCGECCNKKATLAYLPDKEQKICEPCDTLLQRIKAHEDQRKSQAAEQLLVSEGLLTPSENDATAGNSAGPENQANTSTLTGHTAKSGRKSVVFSDGIRPGTSGAATPTPDGNDGASFRQRVAGPGSSGAKKNTVKQRQGRSTVARVQEMECFLPELNCEPTVIDGSGAEEGGDDETLFHWPPLVAEGVRHWMTKGGLKEIWKKMEDLDSPPVEFAVKRNLSVNVKLLKLKCCSPNKQLWCFATQGMRCVAQDEIVILFEREPEEHSLPLDVLRLFDFIYEDALQGHRLGELGHLVFAEMSGLVLKPGGFLGSKEHAGFVFFRPTLQCLRRLPVPDPPYLVGHLIMKTEIPWAKILPMRLLYRLGAEYHFYPCPLMSVRKRAALFQDDIGHTVMNLLADFRNYSFSMSSVRGSRVHLTEGEIKILVPRSQHAQLMKIVEGTQQHVVAWATCFSREADSHLVCVQDPESDTYQTQIICSDNKKRTVTGATFVVFNACLKGPSGSAPAVNARSTMTEDGVMVQMRPEAMEALIGSMKARENHVICEGQSDEGQTKVTRIALEWTDDPEGISNNAGYSSPIDGKMLENLPCLKVSGRIADHSGGDGRLLRMTELFVLETDLSMDRLADCSGELLALGRHVVNAAARVLLPYGHELAQTGLRAVGIRISLGPDTMEYETGAGGQSLPGELTGKLDGELVPLLFTRAQSQGYMLTVELVLRLLDLQ